MDEAELQRLDNLTPKYKSLLDNLSPQKRKVLSAMAREDKPLRVVGITAAARLHQQNRASSLAYVLKSEGLLTRNDDGKYIITDPNLRSYIRARSGMNESPIKS